MKINSLSFKEINLKAKEKPNHKSYDLTLTLRIIFVGSLARAKLKTIALITARLVTIRLIAESTAEDYFGRLDF